MRPPSRSMEGISMAASRGHRSRAISCLSARASEMPKWKMLAASAASAFPRRNTSAKCLALPAPPEAMTGIWTASLTAAVSSQSKPSRVPSASMEVSRISPAPRCSASRAHSRALRPVGLRPPSTKTSCAGRGVAACVDGHDDRLRSEACADLVDQLGSAKRGGVDADFVGSGIEDSSRIVERCECRRRR